MKLVIDIPEEEYKRLMKHKNSCFVLDKAVVNGTPLHRCKDCKYFETDVFEIVYGIPIIVAHEKCSKWGDGCQTKEDGYCFLFEPQESEVGKNNDEM